MIPEEVEKRHTQEGRWCLQCKVLWPCDASALLVELAERQRRDDFCEKVVDAAVRHYETMPRAALETHTLKLNSLIAARDLEIKAVETELEKLTAQHAQAVTRMTWLEDGCAILKAIDNDEMSDYRKSLADKTVQWLAAEPKTQQTLREGEG